MSLFRERLDTPLPRSGIEQRDNLPTWAYDWAKGDTYAWVIEFLDARGAVEFRVHWQDAASAPGDGWLPASIAHDTTHRLDVAIICTGNFDMVDGYPEAFLRDANPRHLLLGHWESFFAPQGNGGAEMNEVLSGPKMARRLASVASANWNTPHIGTKVRYCLCPP